MITLALSVTGLVAAAAGLTTMVVSYRTRLHNARHALRAF
jgi:hypothetical protein